jgi:berberine-like enzyme
LALQAPAGYSGAPLQPSVSRPPGGKNLARLGEIKARWDPANLFRTNKNVAPAATR